MRVLFGNARGIGNLDTRLVLQKFCKTHNPDILFIVEPWIEPDQIPFSYWKQLKLKLFTVNSSQGLKTNLWGLYAEGLTPTMVVASNQ